MLTDADIAELRSLHRDAMMHTCVLITRSITYDNSWREPQTVETESEPKPCQFIPQLAISGQAREYVDAGGTVHRAGPAVRLSVDEYENVTTLSRVRITHFKDKPLPRELTFDVVGDPQLVISFVHVDLQEVSR